MVNPMPSSSVIYRWNTARCYVNSKFNSGNPQCFPHGQTTPSVTGNDLISEDAGTISCIVTISGKDYNSEPFTLRISGELLVYCVIACTVYCKQCILLLLATCYCCLTCFGMYHNLLLYVLTSLETHYMTLQHAVFVPTQTVYPPYQPL